MNLKTKLFSLTGAIVVLALIASGVFFNACVKNVEKHELGFIFNRFTGQITVLEKSGWVVIVPLRDSLHTKDLRPYQVQISANERILNAKLVRFDPEGLETFIAWHGRNAGEDIEDLKEILKCYAFDAADGADCPFLEVVSEISPNQGEFAVK